MAVVYFTNNASTGAGSLVAAIMSAASGDVIQPDKTVFERGSIIEIALSSTLIINKTLTLDGGPYRVRLNAGGAFRCATVSGGDGVKFAAFDFVNGAPSAGDGGCVSASVPLTLERCGVYGGVGDYGGGVFARSTLTLNDCVVTGCRAKMAGGGVASLNGLTLRGTTIVGNVSANANSAAVRHEGGDLSATNSIVGPVRATGGGALSYPGSVVDVASSQIGFVVAPPDDFSVDNWTANAWQSWDLRLLDDASPNPSPYRDAGDVDNMSQYDFQGAFRGRETNGVATCSPGAYETIQADLFWVGVDASGAPVASPSFLSADGWAASRFATVSGSVAPTADATLFIGGAAAFSGASPLGVAITLGADGVEIPDTTDAFLTVGATFSVVVGGALSALKLGDWAELTPSSLTIPAVEFIGGNASIAGVPVSVLDGVIFAASAQPATLATTGSGGWADVTANVTALSVAPVDDRTVTVVITKGAADKAAFAQVSDDDGATWQAIPTTAAESEYAVAVEPGSDVAVRVATANGWLAETVSTAPFLPVWTVTSPTESVTGIVNAYEIAPGGSNTGNNSYVFSGWGNL